MKINPAAFALLAATAAAVPITSGGTITTPRITWTVPPTSTTTAAEVEACVMPNSCGTKANDKSAPATPEPAATSATFEACVMPDGCSDNLNDKSAPATPEPAATSATFEACIMPDGCWDELNDKAVSTGLPPQATPPPVTVSPYAPIPTHSFARF